jgi:ABC-type dipeptide/oligopeptide/nickel transport system permease component
VTRFIIRRLLLSIPVLFGIILLVFVPARATSDPPAMLGEKATDRSAMRSTSAMA